MEEVRPWGFHNRFAALPFSTINLGFFQKIFGRSTAASYVPDFLRFLFSATNLGFFRKIVGRSTAASYVPDLLCFLFSATNLGFFGKIVGRSTTVSYVPDLCAPFFRDQPIDFRQDSRKKYSGELCTRFAVLPFSEINRGFLCGFGEMKFYFSKKFSGNVFW